jgi:hypothetical protein
MAYAVIDPEKNSACDSMVRFLSFFTKMLHFVQKAGFFRPAGGEISCREGTA